MLSHVQTSTSPIDEVITPESTKAVLDVDMRLGQLETEAQGSSPEKSVHVFLVFLVVVMDELILILRHPQ